MRPPESSNESIGLSRTTGRPSLSDVENPWASSDTSVNGRSEERRNDRKDTEMRKLIATEWMSLDGVVQAPSYPDEDRSGRFDRGGWHTRYFDDLSMNWVIETVRGAGGYLLGRGTYEIFAAHWPNASQAEQVLAEPLNMRPKYVASTTLVEPLEWQHSTLLRENVDDAVRALKAQDGDDLLVIGSPGLVQSLVEHDLLDEVRVMIDPLVVGGGKRLFGGNPIRALRLVESQVTGTGAIIATYAATNKEQGERQMKFMLLQDYAPTEGAAEFIGAWSPEDARRTSSSSARWTSGSPRAASWSRRRR